MSPLIQVKMSIARCGAALGLFASIIFVGVSTVPAADPPWGLQGWLFEQFQPPIKPGGRANTIAVHPNDSIILVASESGGLFRSDDGGKIWHHVDSLPVFYTNAVAFAKDPNVVIVTASEDFSVANRGGIWRSENGGKSWAQVLWPDPNNPSTKLPHPPTPSGVPDRFSAYEISIAPDTGNIYVADSYGVSIADPEGKNWKQIDPFKEGRPRAVSVIALPKTTQGADLVLAAGPAGIRRSIDGGKSWLKPTPTTAGPSPDAITDMHALGRSPVAKDQAFVAAPISLDKDQQKLKKVTCSAPASCWYMVLYSTKNGGDTWQQEYIAPDTIGFEKGIFAGGIAGVKAIGDVTSFDLYFSSRLIIYRRPSGGSWKPFILFPDTSEAGDTRDIAFNSQKQPVLAATDGGLIKQDGLPNPPSVADIQTALKNIGDYSGAITGSVNADTQKALTKYQSTRKLLVTGTVDQPTIDSLRSLWTFAGANSLGNEPNGYNALQIYEVKGQWIGNSQHNLYFGTQDNSLWSSGDTGKTWQRCCNEGGYFEGEFRVATPGDSQITFYASTNFQLPSPLFTCSATDSPCYGNVLDWKLSNCEACGKPKIISKDFHVQGVNLVLGPYLPGPPPVPSIVWSKGLAVSPDFGLTWQQYAKFDQDRRDLPKFSWPPKTKLGPVLYQAIKVGWDPDKGDIVQLARITKPKGPLGTLAPVTVPDPANFGGIGMGPTMGDYYRVFAVDPDDVNHLIAADVIKEKMMETSDGGKSWTEIPQLTYLVKDGGKLNFSGRIFWGPFSSDVAPASQASAISFCPDNPDMVAVGTVQNGIFISNYGGKEGTWTKVPGSEHATLISSLHWRKPDEIIVSTYGRGLWRVRFNYIIPIYAVCKSPDCFHIYYERPPGQRPSPYDQAVVAFGGPIQGGRLVNGVLKEVYVAPGTTVAFGTDLQQVPDIKVTETTRPMRFQGITRMPRPPREARLITGLTLKKRGDRSVLVGFLFSPRPRSMYTPKERGEAEAKPVGQEPSPTEGKPYLEVPNVSLTPGATIQLAGRGLRPGSKIEIAIDGNTIQKLAADREGKFSSAVQAPTQFGFHSLTLIDSASRKILDGAMVSVEPQDSPPSR
jgi:photosystem II stability/assembly factor-like uncharacterized protein